MQRLVAASLALALVSAVSPGARAAGAPAQKKRSFQVKVPPSDETLTRLVRLRTHLRNLKMDTIHDNGQDLTTAITADIGGGRLVAVSAINWKAPDGPQRARMRVTNVDAAELVRTCDIALQGKITAKASGTLDLKWRGIRFRTIYRTLDGKVSIDIGPGSFSNTKYLDSLASVSGIPELRRIEFDSGRIDATVREGVVTVNSFVLSGKAQKIVCRGTVSLESEEINLHFEVAVARELIERSTNPAVRAAMALVSGVQGKEAKSKFVEIPVPVTFVGTVGKPQIALESANVER